MDRVIANATLPPTMTPASRPSPAPIEIPVLSPRESDFFPRDGKGEITTGPVREWTNARESVWASALIPEMAAMSDESPNGTDNRRLILTVLRFPALSDQR
jgi:hypothetical protein